MYSYIHSIYSCKVAHATCTHYPHIIRDKWAGQPRPTHTLCVWQNGRWSYTILQTLVSVPQILWGIICGPHTLAKSVQDNAQSTLRIGIDISSLHERASALADITQPICVSSISDNTLLKSHYDSTIIESTRFQHIIYTI